MGIFQAFANCSELLFNIPVSAGHVRLEVGYLKVARWLVLASQLFFFLQESYNKE